LVLKKKKRKEKKKRPGLVLTSLLFPIDSPYLSNWFVFISKEENILILRK
jgi:hypothetical protein